MEALYYIFSWGSPLGLGSLFLLSGIGAGVFFWGLAHFVKNNNADNKKQQATTS
jgi:hypothetical protein